MDCRWKFKGTLDIHQGIRIKGMEMVLVWHEKASRTALQTGSLFLAHAPETQFKPYSQGRFRTLSSNIIKLEKRIVYCEFESNNLICMKISLILLTYQYKCNIYLHIINLFLSKQLTLHKCILLDCTNAEIFLCYLCSHKFH